MNIELTKDQYTTLLKLMYCGEWILNSYKTREDKVYPETDKFEQFIFSSWRASYFLMRAGTIYINN